MGKNITVYSTATCPYCKMVKQFLEDNEFKYKEVDVGKDKQGAHEMVEKSGHMGVPVVDIDGEIIVGFDKPAIKKALNI